jgi:hypothetical protein
MCPSDIYELFTTTMPAFGPETEVFSAEDINPCSIKLKDFNDALDIRIQVKTDLADWKDYEPGELIIGRRVKCRLRGFLGDSSVKIEVFRP